ncbi:hypothetical protein SNE25_18295 [Mucilaginibacter sabulilitoris]|uniref:Uncharacterized protein n=1 Tax=Mucilaginibacter sabulilitoris TaxID=1173583 RepID=A0ABZ0TJA2_9SPHI|nr:hypothetical protein [Mucilaginibacter sabulilitoris]WPU91270.1 hypothetical protein SNE25_18295 [Mucilaginibacter sabulilitoris]
MGNNKAPQSQKHVPPIKPSLIQTDNRNKKIIDEKPHSDKAKDSRDKGADDYHQRTPIVEVTFPKERNWSLANKIAAVGVAINFALIFITGISLKNAINYNTLTQQSLIDATTRFEQENQPFLQIFVQNMIVEPSKFSVKYSLNNLSNTPVKIIETRVVAKVDTAQPNFEGAPFNVVHDVNSYVVKESPLRRFFGNYPIYPDAALAIKAGAFKVYIMGQIRYENLISHKIRLYDYKLKCSIINGVDTYTDFIENENRDL